VSINNEIVHGIPSSRKLKAGDIVGLDFGVVYEGFYGDSARTIAVGPVPERVTKLLNVTRDSLYAGIAQARAGNRISDIAHAVRRRSNGQAFQWSPTLRDTESAAGCTRTRRYPTIFALGCRIRGSARAWRWR
jgi:methionine aminopeptidase